jgi:hypothetical protein
MPLKRRAVTCLFLLPFTLVMATKLRSQSRAAAAKQPKPAANRKPVGALRALSATQRQWVDGTLRKMTVDEKIGQLLFTTYHGTFTATDSNAYQQMMHDVRDLHAGGFILITRITPLGIEKSQAYPTAVLNNQLQSKSKLPLLNAGRRCGWMKARRSQPRWRSRRVGIRATRTPWVKSLRSKRARPGCTGFTLRWPM